MIFPPKLHKVTILAKNTDKPEVIRQLHKLGVLHISQSPTTHGMKADTSMQGTDEISKALLQLRHIAKHTNTKTHTTLSKLPTPLLAVTEAKALINKYLDPMERLLEEEQEISDEIERITYRQELLKEIPFSLREQQGRQTRIYQASKPVQIRAKNAQVETKKVKNTYYTKIVIQDKYVDSLEEKISQSPLKSINTSFVKKNTAHTQKILLEQLKQAQADHTHNKKQLYTLLGLEQGHLTYLITSLENHYDAYTISNKFSTTQELFTITGYCEKSDFEKLQALQDTVISAEFADTQAPTKLRNNKVVGYFEEITKLYSVPKYGHIDPTSIISIFFVLFFGLMFADIGYGLILLALLPVLKNKVEAKWPRRILLYSAISTILFGFVFGSFFGELIPIQPLYTDSFSATIPLLILSIALGLIHINLAATLHIIQSIKNKKGFWAAMQTVPIYVVQLAVIAYIISFPLIGHALLALAAALLIREKGVFGVMDLTSYVGSTFSYARILALSLATAGVALAVNTIAEKLLVFSGIGVILWVLVIVLGHAFNFVVSIIGIGINAARLHYVEFFSLFFEGGGELFEPFMRKNYTEVQ